MKSSQNIYGSLHIFHKIVLVLCLLSFPVFVKAQYVVTGKYSETSGEAIPFANVLLLNSTDSTLVKGEITDGTGSFTVVSDAGKYLLSIRFMGYEDYYSQEFQLDERNSKFELGEIVATDRSQQLDAVIIAAEKPLFEQKIDRTIVNVENSITASGGSALDVLIRSPGVTVDRMNNSVALAGKQGVRIMINGKIIQTSPEAVVQMLDGMTAENIEKIELITTPPAKYEAEGDGGLINIVLKQQTDEGTNSNLSMFLGYGREPKYGGNINFNNRRKKLNLYGDYSYNMNITEQLWTIDRFVNIDNDQYFIATESSRDAFTKYHSGRLGADWNINKKTTVGGLVTILDRHWEMDALAGIDEMTNNDPTGFVRMSTFEINEWALLVGNINLSHVFNDIHSISMDLDHIYYVSDNPTDYDQLFFDQNSNLENSTTLKSRKETPINTWVGKADYIGNYGKKLTFEAGAKGSFSSLRNHIVVEQLEDGQMIIDPQLTSHAEMIENISAAYTSTTVDVSEKIDMKIGLRYEHTITKIDTREGGNVVDRNFGSWFPSFFFQNSINKNNSWVFSYSRRITRPSFFQIAPFVIFVDPNSFWSGNIKLLPAMTDALKAEYRYKSILFSLQYSHDKNSISLFQPRITEEGKQVSSAENMDYRNTYSINLSTPFNITDWWECQLNMSGNMINIKTSYLDKPVDLTIKNFIFNGTQKFSLPNQFSAEISCFYQSKQLWGVLEMKALGGIDVGIEKKFQHSQLRLSISDILNTNKWSFATNIPEKNLDVRTLVDFETRIVRVTFNTSFGNRKLKAKKSGATGSEEEQRRFQ